MARARGAQATPVGAGLPAERDLAAGRQRTAARDRVHFQPGRLRRGGRAVPGGGPAADHAQRGRGDEVAERRTADIPPEDLTVLGYGHGWMGYGAGSRRTMRHAARVQGSGRGTVRGRPGPRRVRDRDAGPRHQHASQDRGHREAGQVERRDPCEPDRGGVHPADRARRRRGIDVEGHAVVLWQPGIDPGAVGGLASTRTYPLNSSFRPSSDIWPSDGYLTHSATAATARPPCLRPTVELAQFQADHGVVG